MTIATVVERGFGSSISDVATRGFTIGAPIVAPPDATLTTRGFGANATIGGIVTRFYGIGAAIIPPPPEPPKGGGPALGGYSRHHRKKRSLDEILEEIQENPPRAVRKIEPGGDDLSKQVARLEAAIAKEIKARTDRLSNERLNRVAAIAARRIVQRIMDEEDAATLLLLS